jgi:hypothetical protein
LRMINTHGFSFSDENVEITLFVPDLLEL